MHDTRVNIIVASAFDGMGDMTGSDEFGYSVAWIDLDDYVEIPHGMADMVPDSVRIFHETDWNYGAHLQRYLASWRDIGGCRYALAYIDADGSRSTVGYHTYDDMMHAYREHERAFLAWEESAGNA